MKKPEENMTEKRIPTCPHCGRQMKLIGINRGHKVYRCTQAHGSSQPPKNAA